MSDDDSTTVREAGRGGLALAFAKAYFIVAGIAQQLLLPRVLGLDGYGALSSVLSVGSITSNPIVTTSIQGVSRAVAQSSEEDRPSTVRRVLSVHAVVAVLASIALFALVPVICGFMRAPHIVGELRLVCLVLLFYGLYSPLIGVLNGSRRFVAQASFDVVAATLRTVALVAGGYALSASGRGVTGSVSGFVVVAALLFVAAAFVVGLGRRGTGGPSAGRHWGFIAPLLLGQVLLNLLLQADLTLLRRFAGEAAVARGLSAAAADPLVGAYRATQLFSFLPYQLLVSVTFILFPMIAAVHRRGDRAALAAYVTTGVRIALLVTGLMVSVTCGLSGPLLRLVYTQPEIAELGAQSMQILTLGFGAFASLGVLTAVLNSLGREKASAGMTAIAFLLIVVLCFALVSGAPFGQAILYRTAVSTSVGLVGATLGAAVLVYRTAGAVVAPLTFVRVLAALAAAVAVARSLPQSTRLVTIAEALLVMAVYVGSLTVLREIGAADVAKVRQILGRKT
jgi:stage V sporulation protein B